MTKTDHEVIAGLIAKGVPKSYPEWSYQKVVLFKDAIRRADTAVKDMRSTPNSVAQALIYLRSFYE